MRRGGKKYKPGMRFLELPQTVRLEYDRGRVSMAVSIQAHNQSIWASGPMRADSPKASAYVSWMMSLAQTMELLLAQHQPLEVAAQGWHAADAQLAQKPAAKRRAMKIVLACIVIVLFAIVATFALMSAFAG
jgi:hypothetical protein